ncbi:MAG: polymer-forming cytoskeletal protein [Anaerolineales bacterium]|nr:polymer-forming cytoskeletal protein [Anaerolineales bacterium]
MKPINKILSIFSLIALLTMTFTSTALAFDGRGGDNVVIGADEVIEDDVYVGANNFTLDGTIKGDLIVSGSVIVINGTVEGDLFAMGQSVVINGTVTDDVRIAGAGLQLGEEASIGGDLLGGGASLEAKKGSAVDGDFLFGGGQALVSGEVGGDAMFGAGALELRGQIGGNVVAEVGDAETGAPPSAYMWQTGTPVPSVQPGFTIGENAKIEGNLVYTQSSDIQIPDGSVIGKVTRKEPAADTNVQYKEPTMGQKVAQWSFDLIRTIVTLILFGLLLGWLAPKFMKSVMGKLQTTPAASLGWGVVSYAAFFFALLVILTVMILGGVIFGMLTLGGVSGTIIWLGILAIFVLIVGFVLVTAFVTKIVVAWLSGKWILGRFNPALADHKVWPLVIGVVIVALLLALPYVGWIFGLFVMFLGLGALWLWGRELWQARRVPA